MATRSAGRGGISLVLFLTFLTKANLAWAGTQSPERLANPLQGTDSSPRFSHGNTYPEIALPFPMNAWSAYTEPQDNSFFYQYRHHRIYGIRQTHQPSVWIRDHANFALMPVSGKPLVAEPDRASTFNHENEIAQPAYYKVYLDTWQATAEVTPTERAARFRFTYEKPGDSYLIVDVFKSEKDCSVEIIPEEHKIVGVARNNSGAVPDNFANYFVIVFDRPFTDYGTWSDRETGAGIAKRQGRHIGAYLKFDTAAQKTVECKAASSFISTAQALLNLQQEIGDTDFEGVRLRAEKVWDDALERVQVSGGSEEQERTFYSALYRSILFPHRFYEMDENRRPVHYSPYDGRVHTGVMYTDSGYWDTFRAAHPLYVLLYPEIGREILQSVVQSYNESGWLPAWSSPGNRQAMIGNHAFSILADGWVKGLRDFDLTTAVNAMVHDAHNGGWFGMGRGESKVYDSLGYIPAQGKPDATAKTLEYAYDDYCAALLANAAGRQTEAEAFRKSAMNYTNVFDKATGFMRGRREDGSWVEPFDPAEWGGPFTEGNAWQWTWSVMHDVPGLITAMGGERAFCDKLDAMFNAGSEVKVGTYRTMIHEMNEMVAQNLGQYAHGNEPVHHVVYLYGYAGQPWKTQVRVRQVMNTLYQSTPDGLCGDEDTGQMSAWYVFSALGFYPVCPGDPNYLIGSPIFEKAVLHLAGGKVFTIIARDNGPQEFYVESASLNGQRLNQAYIGHDALVRGGELVFQMASFPNYQWAADPAKRPPAAVSRLQ